MWHAWTRPGQLWPAAVLRMLVLAETLAIPLSNGTGQHVGIPTQDAHCCMAGNTATAIGRVGRIGDRSCAPAMHRVMYAHDMPLRANHPGDVAAAVSAAEKHGATTAAHTPATLGGPPPLRVVRLQSRGAQRLNVLLTAAVHGNEPAGPAAALQLISRLLGTGGGRTGGTAGAMRARNLRDSVSFTVRAVHCNCHHDRYQCLLHGNNALPLWPRPLGALTCWWLAW